MNASMRKVVALISKDFTDLLKNPTMVVSCVLPVGFALIYRFMWADMGVDAQPGAADFMTRMLLTTALCMAVGMVCTLTVVSGIAEEKEKHTLRTLMLANVSAGQIVVARSFVTQFMTTRVEAASFLAAGHGERDRGQGGELWPHRRHGRPVGAAGGGAALDV